MKPENTDTPLKADCPSATCSALSDLLEKLEDWGSHFREERHRVTLTIFRARKTISDQSDRIGELMAAMETIPRWRSIETPPESMGWYLGNFDGAVQCIGYDKEGWGFWGMPCDERPEFLTHWMPIPSLPNARALAQPGGARLA